MNELNPYAPTAAVSTTDEAFASPNTAPPRTLRTVLIRWSLVVGLAAAPSFVWGFMVSEGQWLAMLLGVMIFIAGYTWVDLKTASTSWRQTPSVRRTLVATYGLRMLMTVVFPVGGYIDMITGLAALTLTGAAYGEAIGDGNLGFGLTLITTLVQGVLLNIMLFVIGLLLLPIVSLIGRWRTNRRAAAGTMAVQSDPLVGDYTPVPSSSSSSSASSSSR